MQLTGGNIECLIETKGPNQDPNNQYVDIQLQQWRWTNSPPIQINAVNQIFDATWSVTGSGSKFTRTVTPTSWQTSALNWTENGSQQVKLQVRLGSNNRVILTTSSSPYLSNGLTGTRVDSFSWKPQETYTLTANVDVLSLPDVQWDRRRIDRVVEGSVDPAPVVASLSPSLIGSRLGQKFAPANAYAGSQRLSTPPTGTQYAGTTAAATANWSWRIQY
jgi:hypothetical protein